MPAPIDMAGQRFGRLVALSIDAPRGRRTYWRVRCDCGVEKSVDGAHMRYGRINSCGCLAKETAPAHARRHLLKFCGQNRTHGMSKTAVYAVWKTMHDRCRNPKNNDYRHYGGRGIKVCDRWTSFDNFIADMGPRPDGLTIERRENDGNYEPNNCHWAPWSDQVRNRRPHADNLAAQ